MQVPKVFENMFVVLFPVLDSRYVALANVVLLSFSKLWVRYGINPLFLEVLKLMSSVTHLFKIPPTYIHNWSLQPFSQDYDLYSITHLVCVNFIHVWWDLQFKVKTEHQIFEKLFVAEIC